MLGCRCGRSCRKSRLRGGGALGGVRSARRGRDGVGSGLIGGCRGMERAVMVVVSCWGGWMLSDVFAGQVGGDVRVLVELFDQFLTLSRKGTANNSSLRPSYL